MTTTRTASDRIVDEVTSWPGVTASPGSRGELSIEAGPARARPPARRPGSPHRLSRAVWHELYDEGRIDYHPVFPGKPGFGSRTIDTEDDVRDVIELLRLNYDRAAARHGLPD